MLRCSKKTRSATQAPAKCGIGNRVHRRSAGRSTSQALQAASAPNRQNLILLLHVSAKRQGPTYRPVYHATPLKPYGALINFNQAPYEKHQLKNMKPIKVSGRVAAWTCRRPWIWLGRLS